MASGQNTANPALDMASPREVPSLGDVFVGTRTKIYLVGV